jgi:ATP-binding cassette subfamily B multidrug efflux pump
MSQTSYNPVSMRQTGDWRILLRCFRYLRGYWQLAVGAYIAMLVLNVLTLLTPQIIRWIIDRGIDRKDLRLLGWSVAGLLALTALKGIVTYFQGRWSEIMSQGTAYDLRNALHAKLASLSFAYHDRTETGQLLSRAVQDVDRIRFLTGRAILRLVDSGVLLIGTTIVLISMNPLLALLSLSTMPFLVHRAYEFGRRNRPLSVALQQQVGILTTQVEQALRGARVVKAFAQEDRQSALFDAENDRWFDLSAAAARLRSVNTPLLDFIANLGTVAVIWYGGTLVMRGQLTLGELVAFSTYLGQLVMPVRRIGMIIPAVSMAIASGERIFDILDAPSEVEDAPDAIPLPPVQGYVRFEQVSFGYLRRHRVLNDVTFEAKPGQVIALLGATGSGKSSIINLIPRFYDPTEGRVTIDGYDLQKVQLTTLRDQVGIVLQETTLFAATLEENIAFGRPDATHEDVVEAAKAAQAHEFIMHMPEGYATHVGERGVTLSGGQKQRIAIARALLKDPRILILDDATASVDTETERQIQAALLRLMQGRTSFVIAQRLSTVRRADLILVLERGHVAAQGTHQELLQSSPIYAEVYDRQLRPQAQEQEEESLPPVSTLQPRPSPAD